jgi:serine/threonine-protein kinase
MPQGRPGQQGQGPQPEQPHPWQTQLRAARDRNEQTQIQYLDPNEDPLRRRPQRQVARPQQQPRQAPQARPQQPQQRRPAGYGHAPQQPQQYAPQPQQYAPQPQRYAPEPQRPVREPRPPRQRSANPMKIPGLGCLKGCLFTIVILVVASWLVWELTPLHTWVGQGKGYWDQMSDWAGKVGHWVKKLGSSSGNGN